MRLVLGFQFAHTPGVPVPPGAVTPLSRTWIEYDATPETASVPDHDTVKLFDDCDALRLPTAEVGAVVSRLIVSEAATDTLPSPSRNQACTVLVPSPPLRWNGRLAAYGCQLLSTKVPFWQTRTSVTPTLSAACRVSVT